MEGHADMPCQSAKDLWESEALDSSPFHLPSWSLSRRLPSSHPNTRHCLEIHVTLMEELGAVPPPSHSWMTPLVEDMLHDVRVSLTEVVVTGPVKAVLFHGIHSLGEGLTTDGASDATFLLTRAGTWVGKLAYLSTNPMTIQEGQWVIAQAITDCCVNARGPGHPCVNLLTQQPFKFDHPLGSPMKDTSGDGGSDHQPLPHQPWGAKTTIDIGETKGFHCLSSHHLPQTVGSRVTGAHCQWFPQCHPCLIDQRDPGNSNEGDSTKRTEPIWR